MFGKMLNTKGMQTSYAPRPGTNMPQMGSQTRYAPRPVQPIKPTPMANSYAPRPGMNMPQQNFDPRQLMAKLLMGK